MNNKELKEAMLLQTTVIEGKEAQIEELRAKVEKVEIELAAMTTKYNDEDKRSTLFMKDTQAEKAKISEMHACFDEIEGVMPRMVKVSENSWDSEVEMPLPSRFASYCRTLIK